MPDDATNDGPTKGSFVTLALRAISGIKHQGLLLAIALFVIVLIFVIIAMSEPDVPWKIRIAVSVAVLSFVCFMVYSLAGRFIYTPKIPSLPITATLGGFRDALEKKTDQQLLQLVRKYHLP